MAQHMPQPRGQVRAQRSGNEYVWNPDVIRRFLRAIRPASKISRQRHVIGDRISVVNPAVVLHVGLVNTGIGRKHTFDGLADELVGANCDGEHAQQDHRPSMAVAIVDIVILAERKSNRNEPFSLSVSSERYMSSSLSEFPVGTDLRGTNR